MPMGTIKRQWLIDRDAQRQVFAWGKGSLGRSPCIQMFTQLRKEVIGTEHDLLFVIWVHGGRPRLQEVQHR